MNDKQSTALDLATVHVKILGNNCSTILLDKQIRVCDSDKDLEQTTGGACGSTGHSYLSSLSSTLRHVKQETNELLTRLIDEQKTINGKESKDVTEDDLIEDDDTSDENGEITG